ncbi:MAG TPA: type II secretion system F family protein [Pseudomonas sp.]|nr:type II secretion system F family protein [Pseudomonas sp.]
MGWLLIAFALVLGALALLVLELLRGQRRKVQVTRRLFGQQAAEEHWSEVHWQRFAESGWSRRLLHLDSETLSLLNRMGWRRPIERAWFLASQVLLPVVLVAVAFTVQSMLSEPPRHPWVMPLLAFGTGYLLPKRALAWLATQRQRNLKAEVSTFIPLLRILFDAGLTVEQALRVLSAEGRELMPVLSQELDTVLRHVDSGLELGEELRQLSILLDVDELTDCLAILQQLIRQGGGAMNSLLALKKLLDDRRLTQLQEYISKLSGKMAVVMMVFLFPALLIVLAGPGLGAIGRALGGMG